MYRKLIWLPLLAFCALTVFVAYKWAGSGSDWLLSPVAGLAGRLWPVGAAGGNVRLAVTVFLGGLLPVLAGAGLNWAAAFHPGRRRGLTFRLLQYLVAGAGLAVTGFLIYDRAVWAGTRALALSTQAARPLPLILLASQVPFAVLEMAALSLMLAAPFYWLVRGLQVASLERAAFEAWVESRRLVVPAVLLLAAASALEAWTGPTLVSWLLR